MGIINAFPGGKSALVYKNKVEITTSQEWTVPERVSEIRVTCIGGGAAGDKGSADGRGGGGGYFNQKVFQVTPGTKYAITIGTGGTSESAIGGTTSFGDLLSAEGGSGCNGGTGGGGCGKGERSYFSWLAPGNGQVGYGGNGGTASESSGGTGGSTLSAKGGSGQHDSDYYSNSGDGYSYFGSSGGGGAGINGGNGGDGFIRSPGVTTYVAFGGGGGGYGSQKLAGDGTSSAWTDSPYTCAKGGLGYGAGGGAPGGNGAPGICIVEY